ncbi:alpha-1,2-fucosyltransferase [Candidatus Parcubacteria bacterium]|nr:alpha-1,2-fucosyltransferase [Candidatus Parcubacteria bacterium]
MKTKIITIKGGLGNQLFQYAHGLKASLIDKQRVIFDTTFFADNGKDTKRPFLLDKFNIDPTFTFAQMKTDSIEWFFKKAWQKLTGNHGNYHREKYFAEVKDEVLKQFTLKDPLSQNAQDVAKNIQTNSVSIHIRRGDYVANSHHGLCDLEYYYKALHHIKTNISTPHFFIFSDDIEWAKDNLQIGDAMFVSNGDISEVEELILMSMCSHNIIANSTFSWWAAYLNKNSHKIIIGPNQWTRKHTSDTLEILPKTWIQL